MCVEVHNLETNKTAYTVKELARMLDVPLENMYPSLSGMSVDTNSCLCQLDVFETCDKAGYEAKHNEVYDIEIKKKDKHRIDELLKKWESVLNQSPKDLEDLKKCLIIESEEQVPITE